MDSIQIIRQFFRLCLIYIAIICSMQYGYSQIGLKTSYSSASYTNVEEKLNRQFGYDQNIFRHNFEVGVYYRYQIENTGFELLPGVNFGFSPRGDFGLSYKRISFELPILIYPLNMEGDCGCPDFSVRNKFFEKHLFFILSPAINYEIKTLEKAGEKLDFTSIYFKVGIGAGLLLPVSERISIAPNVIFSWAFNDKWDKTIFDDVETKDVSISYNDISFDLRFNYKLFD